MHKLYDLKHKLVEELEGFADKDVNSAALDMIDTLAHSVKNLCKVIEDCEDEEYSSRSMRSYGESRRSYNSYLREPMERYGMIPGRDWSGDDHTVRKLEQMMDGADENTRRAIQKAIQTIKG